MFIKFPGLMAAVCRTSGVLALFAVSVFSASPGIGADFTPPAGGVSLAVDERDLNWADSPQAIQLAKELDIAQADGKKQEGDPAKCKALQADKGADMGVLLRAGCQPTTAQIFATYTLATQTRV